MTPILIQFLTFISQNLGGEFKNISVPKVTFDEEEYCLQEKEIKTYPKNNPKAKPKVEWNWELHLCPNTDIDPKAYRYIGQCLK